MILRQPFNLLFSSEFDSLGFIAGNDESLFAALNEHPAVNKLREALGSGSVSENEIRQFAEQLMQEFRPGELFTHDLILAALAIVLSRNWNTPFAEEFILDLAKLKNPELRRSIAIARLSAKNVVECTDTISRTYQPVHEQLPANEWRLLPTPREECFDQVEEFNL